MKDSNHNEKKTPPPKVPLPTFLSPPYSFSPPPPASYANDTIPSYYPNQNYKWATNLFGCFSNIKICLLGLICPCVAFGKIAEIVNEGETYWMEPTTLYLCLCLFDIGLMEGANSFWITLFNQDILCYMGYDGWMIGLILTMCYSGLYRYKLRRKFLIKGSLLGDCCVHIICHPCALCQEYRQLEFHGFNVADGWKKNMERRRQAMTMYQYAPPMVQDMKR